MMLDAICTPLVSVVMAVHNGDEFLNEAIESILAQSYRDFEFIIVDDGSTDNTPKLLADFAQLDKRICCIDNQGNLGLAESLNIGLLKAAGKYIARMDADDISMPNRFALQVAWLEAHPEIAAVGGQVRFCGRNAGGLQKESCLPLTPKEISIALKQSCALVHPTVMFRRDIILQIGGYRPCFITAQDYDLWLRVDEHADLINLPDIVLDYRKHNGQLSIKRLTSQAYSWIAARESARLRRESIQDPLSSTPAISFELLQAMGLSVDTVYRDLMRFAVKSALDAIACGCSEESSRIMTEMQKHEASKELPRLAYAHQAWVMCYQRKIDRRWLSSVGYLVVACVSEPSYMGKLLRKLMLKIS